VNQFSYNHDPQYDDHPPASSPYPGTDIAPTYQSQDQPQPYYNPNDGGDMGYSDRHSTYGNPYDNHLHPDHGQFGYSNPYAEKTPSETHGTLSSLGPWDSASQRSIGQSSVGPNSQQPLRNKPSYGGGLSYIDEDGEYYSSKTPRPASDIEMRGLVHNSQPMGRDESKDVEFGQVKGNDYGTSPFPYPTNQNQTRQKPSGIYSWLLFPTGLDRVLAMVGVNMGRLPVEQEIERKKRGIPGQRFPIAAWGLTIGELLFPCQMRCELRCTVMTCVMIYELVRNKQLTGSVIATSPQFNYMIGPSSDVLINIGARFIPSVPYSHCN
jgi:hypothetical protein